MGFLSASQTAEKLGTTQQTVSRLAREGRLASETVGGRRVYRSEAIDAYLDSNNLVRAPKDHARIDGALPDITAVSFFSGALGLDLGMEKAGIKSLLMCENDLKCRMTIDSNRPGAALLGDINMVDAEKAFKMARVPKERGIDIVFGGPPCQAFSTAGARRAFNDARGNVFLKYLSLAAEIQPKYLVIENVRGLLSTAFPIVEGGEPVRGGALRIVLNKLDAMGYKVSFNLYNAANFGAPQIRERVVMIAKRDGDKPVAWLTPTNSNDPAWGLPAWKTLYDAVRDIEDKPQTYQQFPEKRLRFFKLLGEGQYWKNLPVELQEEAMGKAYKLSGGKTGFYRRLSFDKPCATLVTSPTMPATDLCHPTEDRPLSIEEYRRVQGFPDDWVFRGDTQDIYRQIGNAVPVALGEAIGKAILADMAGENPSSAYVDFPYSRYKAVSETSWNLA